MSEAKIFSKSLQEVDYVARGSQMLARLRDEWADLSERWEDGEDVGAEMDRVRVQMLSARKMMRDGSSRPARVWARGQARRPSERNK